MVAAESSLDGKKDHRPFFRTNAVLAIPTIVMAPGLEEVQHVLNRAAHLIVSVSKGVAQWDRERRVACAKSTQERYQAEGIPQSLLLLSSLHQRHKS